MNYEAIRKLVKGTNPLGVKPTKKINILKYCISMVEVIANSLEDTLIDGLSFKPDKTASNITNKRSCTYHPQGSSIYTPQNGRHLIKININGSD